MYRRAGRQPATPFPGPAMSLTREAVVILLFVYYTESQDLLFLLYNLDIFPAYLLQFYLF